MKIAPPQRGLAALRHATAASHRSIESLLALDAPFDLRHYERVLQGFALFLAAWEPQVRAALPRADGAWFTARSRQHLLRHDMEVLRVRMPQPATEVAPPVLRDAASAWGSMYVLEGSALGGQVIARQLAQHLGLAPEHGAAYFHGWGAATGAMWRQFRERLEQELAGDTEATAHACEAAVGTFDALAGAFRIVTDEPLVA